MVCVNSGCGTYFGITMFVPSTALWTALGEALHFARNVSRTNEKVIKTVGTPFWRNIVNETLKAVLARFNGDRYKAMEYCENIATTHPYLRREYTQLFNLLREPCESR